MNIKLGILLKITAVLLFTGMFTCIKATADTVPPGQAVFFRSFFTLLPLFIYMALKGEDWTALTTRNPRGHLWRGGISAVAMLLNFYGVGLLPLPDAIAIGYAMPLFTTIFAALLIGEVVRSYRWTAIAVGLFGVFIVMWPKLLFLKGDVAQWSQAIGALSAVSAAALVGLGLVVVRTLVRGEKTTTIVFYFAVLSAAGSLLTIPFGWVWPDATTATILIMSGLSGGTAQILLTESIRYADMSTLAPFEYVSMLASIAISYAVFNELPTTWSLAGASLVILAGLYLILRENKQSRSENRG